MSVLLEVNHLQKYFHTKSGTLHAVENVSFQLEEGKTLAWWESPAAGSPRWVE